MAGREAVDRLASMLLAAGGLLRTERRGVEAQDSTSSAAETMTQPVPLSVCSLFAGRISLDRCEVKQSSSGYCPGTGVASRSECIREVSISSHVLEFEMSPVTGGA